MFLGLIRAFPVFFGFSATAANQLPNRVSKGWPRKSVAKVAITVRVMEFLSRSERTTLA
jgi:hypothetical protein